MLFRKTKKEMYKEGEESQHTYINGETAIKPFYYYRNGYLHVRYTVDRCMKLSSAESDKLKAGLTENPAGKQDVLAEAWSFFEKAVQKHIIMDGIAELGRQIEEFKKNG